MSYYVCEKCHRVDNTAGQLDGTNNYWSRQIAKYAGYPDLNGKALCSACIPDRFEDGSTVLDMPQAERAKKFQGQHIDEFVKSATPERMKKVANYDCKNRKFKKLN